MGNLSSVLLLNDTTSGNSSACNTDKQQELNDLKNLGNNFPFSDKEIQILYRVYNQLILLHQERCEREQQEEKNEKEHAVVSNDISSPKSPQTLHQPASFLQDLALYCYKFTILQLHQQQKLSQQRKNNNHSSSYSGNTTYDSNHQWASEEEAAIFHTENVRHAIERRRQWIEVIERDILPPDFGNRLYEAVFFGDSTVTTNSLSTSCNDYDNDPWKLYHAADGSANHSGNKDDCESVTTKGTVTTAADSTSMIRDVTTATTSNRNNRNNNKNNGRNIEDDEITVDDEHISVRLHHQVSNYLDVDPVKRKIYLESFFRGLAVTSRRGSRAAIKALFLSCHQYKSKLVSGDKTNSTGSNCNRVRATELVDVGYRLALATSYLQYNGSGGGSSNDSTSNKEEIGSSENFSSASFSAESGRDCFIPVSSMNQDMDPVLNAFANSLVECARTRYQRSGMPGCFSTPHPDLVINNGNGDSNSGTIELDDVFEWLESVAPLFGSILPSFIQCFTHPPVAADMAALGELRTGPGSAATVASPPFSAQTSFCIPSVPERSSDFFHSPSSPSLFTLGCLSASLSSSIPYYRLYASTSDGLSFNRLLNAILGYSGPTLFIIRAITTVNTPNDGTSKQTKKLESVFGAFTASPWKEGKDFYGNTDCFLYQLSPCTAVYRPTGSATNYMYCNSNARSKGYDQQAHGIGFGGTVHQPRLFLEETFENCTASSRDLTFENGNLIPSRQATYDELHSSPYGGGSTSAPQQSSASHFDIETLEVWGVGTADAINAGLQSRGRHRDVANEAIRRARKVDKAQFLDDLRSGVIDNKAFKHRAEIDGRADCDVDDRYNAAKQSY